MKIELRNIDLTIHTRCIVYLRGGEVLKGYGDNICWLPIDDDSDIDEEYVCFMCDSGDARFFTNEDIDRVVSLD